MYFLLETDYSVKPAAFRTSSLVTEFKFKPSRWITGQEMGKNEQPIAVEFFQNGGSGLAEILLDSIPLFSKELVEALQEAGVDNLQLFPAEVTERDGNPIDREYFAVNIIGLLEYADMDKSEYTDPTGTGAFAVAFRKLVIDTSRTQGLYIFRLAESVASVIVHEKIKKHLDSKNFKYLSFRPLPG